MMQLCAKFKKEKKKKEKNSLFKRPDLPVTISIKKESCDWSCWSQVL